ncbi:prepilin-type N-terminal cleavage/methylation domain-containing protein [Alteromonas sp. IB21]|uniref:type IV pilin protein n=1 Tax=Alteromonas sp. IB21 TaxID=2779369 RepID=UPI0018E8734E|nr:prepilin-type N-terminal cleavage/methylation domain-containing protein [Alteromonas sp. IB21]MBJ2129999.1 prepilin-type N-terminal cleavage/methylation domain-containing protein [Alteromonas sp. IB21]
MEVNYTANDKRYGQKGFTLIELLVAMAIVGLLSLAATSAINTTRQISEINKVKAHLLSLQAMQSTMWLENGHYLALNSLPSTNIPNVSFTQSNSQGGGYEIAATRLSLSADDSCRTIKISEVMLSPKECW